MLTPRSRHHARVREPETDVQIGRYGARRYEGPETDVVPKTDVQIGRYGVQGAGN